MTDYIRRENALEDFERCNAENPKWTPQRVKTLILRQPAADVAEVVYCKDCKYVNFTEHRDYLRCTKHCAFSFRPNDFCSYGERREE